MAKRALSRMVPAVPPALENVRRYLLLKRTSLGGKVKREDVAKVKLTVEKASTLVAEFHVVPNDGRDLSDVPADCFMQADALDELPDGFDA